MSKLMARKHQQGVALISVLLMFAIITILATQLILRSQADIERVRWLLTEAQAYQYALGGESLARQILWQQQSDLKEDGINISPIPGLLPTYQPDYGQMAIEIIDLQGRLNLNNIAATAAGRQPVVHLLSDLVSNPGLTATLADWTDSDLTPLAGGAEDFHYLSLETPYRTSNQPLADPSEMMALADISAEEFKALRPYVNTLNPASAINPNTAPAEVLSLLDPNLSGLQVVNYRESMQPGFASVDEFLAADIAAGLTIDKGMLTVISTNYGVKIETTINDRKLWLYSRLTLDNSNGEIRLQSRTVGEKLTVNTLETNDVDQDDPATHSLF